MSSRTNPTIMNMRQTTLTISIPDAELELDKTLNRVSKLLYKPKSMLCRELLRDGLDHMSEEDRIRSGLLVTV